MNADRRLADLNPADRPERAPAVAPPAQRPVAPQPPRPQRPADGDGRAGAASHSGGNAPAAHAKARKVMHSVPVDVLDQLKQVAASSERSYTDIVVGCIIDHREHLAPNVDHDAPTLGALGRRRRRGDRTRSRAAQLTLYLTSAERAELDRLAADLGMARSQLVTAALQAGLNEVP